MSTSRKFHSLKKQLLLIIAPIALVASAVAPAAAQNNPEAERLNDAGKKHFKDRRYLDAYKNFKQATAMSPEGRYFFNLCFSLNYLERFEEAIEACEQVVPNGADNKLRDKTNAVLKSLRSRVSARPPIAPPGPNTPPPDPNTPPPDPNTPPDPNLPPPDPNIPPPYTPPNGNPVQSGPVQVPGLDPFAATSTEVESYKWSLGVSLAPVANLGIGSTDDPEEGYGSGGRLNLMANFMFRPEQQIGIQGYLGFTSLPPSDDAGSDVTIFDIGAAVYKHFPVTPSIELTALAGLHVTGLSAEGSDGEAFLALGARASVSADYAFGPNKEHVLSIAPALNLYSGFSDTGTMDAGDAGLDQASASFEFGFAYQYRFTSAFGQTPLFNLE